MKAKWGSFVVDGRGKINGHVASKNRAGAYLRGKVTPSNPQTAAQSDVRARLSAFSQAWSGLTENQRAAWNAAVTSWMTNNVFGDGIMPSGKNLFTRLNANNNLIGGAVLSTPPLPVATTTADISNLAISVGGTSLEFDFANAAAGQYLVIEATAPQTPGTYNPSGRYRVIDTQQQTPAGTVDVWAEYVSKFGAPVAGQKVFLRVKSIVTATGQNTPYMALSAIVAA
jgi:hypothetical protein